MYRFYVQKVIQLAPAQVGKSTDICLHVYLGDLRGGFLDTGSERMLPMHALFASVFGILVYRIEETL